MKNQGIKKNVVSNMFWRFSERVLAQLVAFIVSVILARLLDPDLYGTIALINVFIAIFQVFVDSGLANALIQKKDADDLDFSTVFYANVVFCVFLYVVLFLTAPYIALFFKNDSMISYLRVLGLTILVSGIKNVQQAYVSRKMIFKKFFFATLAGTIVAGIVGVYMALSGAGIWALVFQQITNLTIDTIVLWIIVGWRPRSGFSFERLRKLFAYGWKLLVSALLDTGYRELRQLLIGRVYSSSDLAFYNQGEKIPSLLINNINSSISSVLFPTLSHEQDDRARLKVMTRRTIQASTFILAPMMIGMCFISEPLVRLLWTEKWLPTVFFLRIFCIYFMFYPIHTANLSAINAVGRSDLFLKMEIMKKIVGITLIILTVRVGVKAMAYSLLISMTISLLINTWPNKKLLNYGYMDQFKDIMPNILVSFIMGGIVYIIGLIALPDIIMILLQTLCGAVFYLVISYILKIEGFVFLTDFIKAFIKKEKP